MANDNPTIHRACLDLEALGFEIERDDSGAIHLAKIMNVVPIRPGDVLAVWRQIECKREDLPKIAAAMRAEAESMRVSLN